VAKRESTGIPLVDLRTNVDDAVIPSVSMISRIASDVAEEPFELLGRIDTAAPPEWTSDGAPDLNPSR
jgi:hypothetical protein